MEGLEDFERPLLPTDLNRDEYEIGKMVRLLKKWTSVTYIHRIETLIEKFQAGMEEEISNFPGVTFQVGFEMCGEIA